MTTILAAALALACDAGRPSAPELALEIRIRHRVAPGGDPVERLIVVNRSRDRTIRVVRPGDASAYGWREPYLWWTLEREIEPGVWKPCEPRPLRARCGHHAADWERDVLELRPGEAALFKEHLRPLAQAFDLRTPGRFRLVAHYRYRAFRGRGNEKDAGKLPLENGPMRGVAPFELRSAPVAFCIGD